MSFNINIQKEFKDAIEILKLNKAKMGEVASRESATKVGAAVIVLPVLVNWVLYTLTFPSRFFVFFKSFTYGKFLVVALSSVAMIFLLSYVAKQFFKGKGDHVRFFRILAYASVLTWVSIIPHLFIFVPFWTFGSLFGFISSAATIWLLVVAHKALIEEHKLSSENAILALLVGAISWWIVGSILGNIFLGSHYSLY